MSETAGPVPTGRVDGRPGSGAAQAARCVAASPDGLRRAATEETREDRLSRLAVAGLLMESTGLTALAASRAAREMTAEQRAEITRAAGYPVRPQAAEAVQAHLKHLVGRTERSDVPAGILPERRRCAP